MVPPVEEAVSQPEPGIVIEGRHARRLLPVLVMVTVCPAGLGCPSVVLKFRFSGDAAIRGAVGSGADWTSSWTSTDWVIIGVITEIVAVYVPGLRLLVLTPTVVVVLGRNWPLAGVSCSQLAEEVACQSIGLEQLALRQKFRVLLPA